MRTRRQHAPEVLVPCLVCGRHLRQVMDGAQMQPSDGIYCETPGHYGSTIWDPMNGQYLAFIICDRCMVKAGKRRRVMLLRKFRPIRVHVGHVGKLVVGRQALTRPFLSWRPGDPHGEEELVLGLDELDDLPDGAELSVPPPEIRAMARDRD